MRVRAGLIGVMWRCMLINSASACVGRIVKRTVEELTSTGNFRAAGAFEVGINQDVGHVEVLIGLDGREYSQPKDQRKL